MKVDLCREGVGFCISSAGWTAAIELAEIHGWKPQRTLKRPDYDCTKHLWETNIVPNSPQVLTDADAISLGQALEKAVPDVPDHQPLHKFKTIEYKGVPPVVETETLTTVKVGERLTALEVFGGERELLRDLATFCKGGEFTLW